MTRSTTISPVVENIYAIEAPCDADIDVRALLICGERWTLLIDTLLRPADLREVREMVEGFGQPLFVVNSHADFDHWWGNAAFPEAPILAQASTLRRQLREGERALRRQRKQDPEFFEQMTLRPATITFDGEMVIDLGDIHVELSPLPGHTHDCIVAYIPERRLLFAGDAAEDPIPVVTEGPIAQWPDRLSDWAGRSRVVAPAHGAIAGPELLERNAAYLRGLLSDPMRIVPELDGAAAFYQGAHRRNLKKASAEAGAG